MWMTKICEHSYFCECSNFSLKCDELHLRSILAGDPDQIDAWSIAQVNLNSINANGSTPLHLVSNGMWKAVHLRLLRIPRLHGSHWLGLIGRTPITIKTLYLCVMFVIINFQAVYLNHTACVAKLILHGADCDLKDSFGKSAKENAQDLPRPDCLALMSGWNLLMARSGNNSGFWLLKYY